MESTISKYCLGPVPSNERKHWIAFRNELQFDIDREGGRYGIHGQAAVDDDYFLALEYIVKQINMILSE